MTLLLFTLLLALEPQTCAPPKPGDTWACVCIAGVGCGWVPPSHPGHPNNQPRPPQPPDNPQPPQPPTNDPHPWRTAQNHPDNGRLVQQLEMGFALPEGDVYFRPPLILRGVSLRGVGPGTILRPSTAAAGPLVVIASDMPGEGETGYPRWIEVQNVRIVGGAGQTCLVVNGAYQQYSRVVVSGCDIGVKFEWAVNVTFRDSRFVKGVHGWGLPAGGVATTIRCSGCSFSYYSDNAIYTGTVMGLILDDSTIIEYNPGNGIHAGAGSDVLLRDVWFEQNGHHIYDPTRAVRMEGLTKPR